MKRQVMWILASVFMLSLVTVSLAKDKKAETRELDNAKKGLGMAKLSVIDAIQAGMKKVPGGKAVQADLQIENGQPRYLIEIVAANGKHMEIGIDGISGMAGQATEEKTTSETNSDDEKAEDAASKSKVTLVHAIEAAQKRVPNGKVFGACSEMEDGKAVFSIDILSGDKMTRAKVDCNTGNVLDVKEAA